METGIIGQRTDIPAQSTANEPKRFYQRPLFWVLGATAVTAAAATYFLPEDESDPSQASGLSLLLNDALIAAGGLAASAMATVSGLYISRTIQKQTIEANVTDDLSTREVLSFEEAKNQLGSSFTKHVERRASNQELVPMFPKSKAKRLNSGACPDGYSSKILRNKNVATACARANRIRFGIDNATGEVVSAPTPISTNGDDVANPDLIQEPASENIGITWDKLKNANVIQYVVLNDQGQAIKTESEAFSTNHLFFHVTPRLGIKGASFFTSNAGRSSIEWQEINSSNGNLVGSLKSFARTSDYAMRRMGMVEAPNGNMIAVYEDGDAVMRRQTFRGDGVPVGGNFNMGDSQGPDLVTVGDRVYGVRKSGSNILLDRYFESGGTDGDPIVVASDAIGLSRIATDDEFVAVVYEATDGVYGQIYRDGVKIEGRFEVGVGKNAQASWTVDSDLVVFFTVNDVPHMREFAFNEAPVAKEVAPVRVYPNVRTIVKFNVTDLVEDAEGEPVTIRSEGGVSWGTFGELELEVMAPTGSQGVDYWWSYSGTDHHFNGNFTGGRIPIIVENHAPVVSPGVVNRTGYVGIDMGPICFNVTDVDLDPYSVQATGLVSSMVFDSECFNYVPQSNDIGSGVVEVFALDEPVGDRSNTAKIHWEVLNRVPFVKKGFGHHNVTAGDNFAIVVGDDAYDDLDGHSVRVEDFGDLENWIIANIGSQSLTGSAPASAIGKTFNIHPTFCDSYGSCDVDETGKITVVSEDGGNALPIQVTDYPIPGLIGSGRSFSYRVDVRKFVVDPEGDPLFASVGSPFSDFPEWFKSNVTSNVIVNIWGTTPDNFVGSVIPVIQVRDSEHTSGISEPVTFNIVPPETLAPRVDELVNDVFFDVGKEKWVQLANNVFVSPIGSSIELTIDKESAGLDRTMSSYKKTKWLKIEQNEDGSWRIGGKPGKKATNGVKVTLKGCDIHNLCATQQFIARVNGMSPFEEFVTYGSAAIGALFSAGFSYWWKFGRNGKWRDHKRTVEHYCGEKKDQMKECWENRRKKDEVAMQQRNTISRAALLCG